MAFQIDFKPKAIKDLEDLSPEVRRRVAAKIDTLREGLAGDVKRLTNFTPEFRLRAGDYRVLFELTVDKIVIYRVLHRRESYR